MIKKRIVLEYLIVLLMASASLQASLEERKETCKFYIEPNLFDLTHAFKVYVGHITVNPVVNESQNNVKEANAFLKVYPVAIDFCGAGKLYDQVAELNYNVKKLLSATKTPNIVLTDQLNKTVYELTDADPSKWLPFEPLTQFGKRNNGNDGSIMFSRQLDPNTSLALRLNLGIDLLSINLAYHCKKDAKQSFTDGVFMKSEKVYQFTFQGPQACPIEAPDVIHLLSRNWIFLILLFVSSLLSMFLGKSHERMIMSLTSAQAAILIVTIITSVSNDEFMQNGLLFGIATAAASFITFGFSYFSRLVSVLFVSIAVSYSIYSTLIYIVIAIFQTSIDSGWFLALLGTTLLAVLVTSFASVSFKEKYSYAVYTSITIPCFLMMPIGLFLRVYVDVYSFNKYETWGKVDAFATANWVLILPQIALTFLLSAFRLLGFRQRNPRSSIIHKERSQSDGLPHRDTESSLRGGLIGRGAQDKKIEENYTLIAM